MNIAEPCTLFGNESTATCNSRISSMPRLSNLCFLSKILQWNGTQPQLQKCLGCERSLLDFTPDTVFRCHISIACWTCPGCRSVKPDSSEHYTQGFDYRFFEATQAAIGDFYLGLTHPIRQILDVTHSAPKDQKLLFNLLISLLQYHVPGFDKKSLSALPFLGLS
jgi:recombinational DNA repair protein (RecF pathway)